jgi:apolipoprotein N-acyltransferase
MPSPAPIAIAVLWLGFGAVRLARFDDGGERITVGIVQASVPQAERFQPGSAYQNVARHETATRALAAAGSVDLVVWSETAVDVDLDDTPTLRRALDGLATEIGSPIVTGAPRSSRGEPTNAVVLFAPQRGLVESYDKQRLVPFSEYDPPGFAWLAALIGPVVEGEPYAPGALPIVFREGPLPFSTPICFEITDARLVARFRDAGARLLVNLSNDAWFGRIGYPEMHFDHAILRAVELRTAVVRGANTGISGVVDASGRIVAEQPAFTEGTLRAEVSAAGAPTLYTQTGDAPLVVALFMVTAALARRPGAGRDADPRRSGPSSPAAARERARRGASTR